MSTYEPLTLEDAKAIINYLEQAREAERKQKAALQEFNDSMREGMQQLRKQLQLPAQGEGFVLKCAVVEIARLRMEVDDHLAHSGKLRDLLAEATDRYCTCADPEIATCPGCEIWLAVYPCQD